MRWIKLQVVAIPVMDTDPSNPGDGVAMTGYQTVDGTIPARCLVQVQVTSGSTKLTLWAQSPSGDGTWGQLLDSNGNFGDLGGGQPLGVGTYFLSWGPVPIFPRLAIVKNSPSAVATVVMWGLVEKEEE